MKLSGLIFLFVFFLVYGSMNFYFRGKLLSSGMVDVSLSPWLSAFFAIMTLSLFLFAMFGKALPARVSYVLGVVVFFWAAVMMQFLAWSFLFRTLRYVGQPVLELLGAGWRFPEGGRIDFLLPLAITLGASAYGFWEATQVRTVVYEIRSEKIPPGLPGVRIVQISDLHLGMFENRRRLERVLTRVEAASPDILVSTGDLTDVLTQDREWLIERLKRVNPPLGKFAVTGNHEIYAGLADSVAFLQKAGFRIIQGSAVQLTPFFGLAGVDDDAAAAMELSLAPDEASILSQLSERGFRVFLKHTPRISPDTLGRFDLQLSGHTHGGQIFPFFLVPLLVYEFRIGLTDLGSGSRLLLSRGAGTWGPPIRVFAPPEVCVIDILPPGPSSPP